MQAPVTHILALTNLRRARLLPAAGKVLVKQGQKVTPNDVIAETVLHPRHMVFDVRQALGITRPAQLSQAIERRVGDKVEADDVLARSGGLFKRVLRAPVAGQISIIAGGRIVMEVDSPLFQLRAGLAGIITEIIPERGAILEASGALVQGAWGNGRTDSGVLLSLAATPEDILTRERLDVSMRGGVVLAGHCDRAEVLQNASELNLRGLILGSMTADLIPVANQLDMAILLTEGFGNQPINSTAYRLLTTNEKRDVCINAQENNPFSGARPEVFIDLPAEGEPAHEMTELRKGQEVRIIGVPYDSVIGTLEEILPMSVALPNKLKTRAAIVRLEDSNQVIIPLSNLDVIE